MLLGPPGSGKGTQAELITRHFGIPVTSPGAILRRERDLGTPLGQETAEVLRSGGLVPDKIIIELIEDWLRLHGSHGFVFDGFPRTLLQAESLNAMLARLRTALDLVIWLEVSEETVRDRIAGRLQLVQQAHGRLDQQLARTRLRVPARVSALTPNKPTPAWPSSAPRSIAREGLAASASRSGPRPMHRTPSVARYSVK